MLTTVHNVHISLPTKAKTHPATAMFAAQLERSMKSNTDFGTLGPNDQLEMYADVMREGFENSIFMTKYGNKADEAEKLAEKDFAMEDADQADEEAVEVNFVSHWDEGEEEEKEEQEKKKHDAFTGPGRTLRGTPCSQIQPVKLGMKRTLNKNLTIKTADSEERTRVSWTDNPVSVSKRILKQGVSALDVGGMGISDGEETLGKANKRDPRDSPGSQRPFDLRSVAREGNERRMTRARTANRG